MRPEFERQVAEWLRDGKILSTDTIYDGLERAVEALFGVMSGANVGKMLVRLDPSMSIQGRRGADVGPMPSDVLKSMTMPTSVTFVNDRPSDAAIWASMANTLRTTVLPNVTDPYARDATIQLIGLANYAEPPWFRSDERRHDELAAALEGSAGQDVMRSCIAVLADPYHRAHSTIREILERHLEEDLEVEAMMLRRCSGQVPNG